MQSPDEPLFLNINIFSRHQLQSLVIEILLCYCSIFSAIDEGSEGSHGKLESNTTLVLALFAAASVTYDSLLNL